MSHGKKPWDRTSQLALQLVWSESTGAQILQKIHRWQVKNSIDLSSLFFLTVMSPICTLILQFFTCVHNEMPAWWCGEPATRPAVSRKNSSESNGVAKFNHWINPVFSSCSTSQRFPSFCSNPLVSSSKTEKYIIKHPAQTSMVRFILCFTPP